MQREKGMRWAHLPARLEPRVPAKYVRNSIPTKAFFLLIFQSKEKAEED